MAVHQNQIRPAVVVHVEEHSSPAQVLRVEAQAHGSGRIGKRAVAIILVERGGVVGKIGFKNVEVAIAVVVGDSRAHPGLLAPVFVKGCAGSDCDIGERSIVVVAIENAGRAVAGDENVGPSIFVEVECRHAEGVVAFGAINVGFGGDVFKRAIAAIVIEDILRSGQTARPAHDGNPLPDASQTFPRRRRGRQIEIHIIGHNQIEAAIAIVVDECAARAPRLARSRDAGFLGDFGEHAVLIVVKTVLAVVGDVKIFPSVVVVVANANALAPAGCG